MARFKNKDLLVLTNEEVLLGDSQEASLSYDGADLVSSLAIYASTTPSKDQHLTNKTFVDGEITDVRTYIDDTLKGLEWQDSVLSIYAPTSGSTPMPNVWYEFEGDITDSSGNGEDGAPVGSPTYSTSKAGLGLCKGPEVSQGKYYTAPDLGITGDNEWTWAMWINLNSWVDGGYVFGYGSAVVNQRVVLYYNDPNSMRIVNGSGNPLLEYEGSTYNFPENTWFHLALVYDTTTNVVSYYINGVPEDTYAQVNMNVTYTFHQLCHIPGEDTRHFLGKLDDYMVWDSALTADEVADVYNGGIFSTAPPSAGIITGDRYIVGAGATGAWSNRDDDIAEWDGSTWVYTTPSAGFATWVISSAVYYIYSGSSWDRMGTVVDHGVLDGLADDDHTQYVLVDGTRDLTGTWNISQDIISSANVSAAGDVYAGDVYCDMLRATPGSIIFLRRNAGDLGLYITVDGQTVIQSSCFIQSHSGYANPNQGFAVLNSDHVGQMSAAQAAAYIEANVDHGNLLSTSLSADDHTQYLLADGTRQLGGNLTLTGHISATGLTQDIGSQGIPFNNLWVNTLHTSGGTVYIGDARLYETGGTLYSETAIVAPSGSDPNCLVTEERLEDFSIQYGLLHDHDSDYYTITLLDGGQLDNRYYTETEIDTNFAPASHNNTNHSETYIEAAGVTYGNLAAAGDIGTGSDQVSQGDHAHAYSAITGTHGNEDHSSTFITSAGVTFANLDAVGDVGIADNKILGVDDADAADNDYAKFTTAGIEGRSYAEVKADLTLDTTDTVTFGSVTCGDTTLGDHGIELDSDPDADDEWCGSWATMQVDANTVGFGSALHLDTDGNWIEADADLATTMPCMALALETGTGSKKVLMHGFIKNTAWTWTKGAILFVSAVVGTMTHTAPAGAGDQIQSVGIAIDTDTVFFNPSHVLVERA